MNVHSLRDHVTVGNYSHTVTGPPWNSSHGALTFPNLLQIHYHFSSTDSYSLNFDILSANIEINQVSLTSAPSSLTTMQMCTAGLTLNKFAWHRNFIHIPSILVLLEFHS